MARLTQGTLCLPCTSNAEKSHRCWCWSQCVAPRASINQSKQPPRAKTQFTDLSLSVPFRVWVVQCHSPFTVAIQRLQTVFTSSWLICKEKYFAIAKRVENDQNYKSELELLSAVNCTHTHHAQLIITTVQQNAYLHSAQLHREGRAERGGRRGPREERAKLRWPNIAMQHLQAERNAGTWHSRRSSGHMIDELTWQALSMMFFV